MKLSVVYGILVMDIIFMALAMFINISNFNGVINAVYAVPIFLVTYRYTKFWIFVALSTSFFILVSSFSIYSIFDGFTVVDTIGMVLIFCNYRMKQKELILAKKILLAFYILNLLMVPLPFKYSTLDGEVRFLGIFNAGNLSVSVMTMCGVAIWEMEKVLKRRPNRKLLILNLVGFIILIIATRTRTVLFLFPYWFLQCNRFFNRRIFFSLLIIVGLASASLIVRVLVERLNIEGGDSSSNTRAVLYLALIQEILNNYVIIPHGSNEAFFFIKKLTGDTGFTSHNDILRYLYDWGGYFIVFLLYIFFTIKKYVRFNLEFNFILLGFSALALHNMLFLPITWIPFCLIMHVREKKRHEVNQKKVPILVKVKKKLRVIPSPY